jgi:hypothetical protein
MNDVPDPFDADVEMYLSQAADSAVLCRLNAALSADAALRERFVTFSRLHAHLGEIGRKSAAGEVGTARLLAVHVPHLPLSLPQPVVRGRRWWSTVAAAAALIAIGLAVLSLAVVGLRTQALVPTVASSSGTVQVWRDGRELVVAGGLRLRDGDRIEVPPGANLTLSLIGGRCDLAGGSSAVVEAADELHRRVVLERGAMSADLTGRELFAVRTAAATISLADAAAAIDVGPLRTAVRVTRGSLELRPADGAARRLGAGEEWVKTQEPEIAAR